MNFDMDKIYDIIIVSGEPYVDHPFSGVGVIKKVLEDKGYSVAVIETPRWDRDDDFIKFGKPKLFFGVSSGAMDSMLVNYTPMKKKRQEDEHSKMSYSIPDRAVTVYCNMIRKLFKDSKIVIAGTESSLRRFAHYDYWENRIRKSILLDTRADILVYGYGELQITEIAKRLTEGKEISGINGTCILSKDIPAGFEELPSFEKVASDKKEFCKMQTMFDINKNLAQKFDNRYVLQYKAMKYIKADLDYIYGLDYSRKIPSSYPEFRIIEFSVLTHRGCFGGCNFCSISALSGKDIVSRSIESIIAEIKKIVKMPNFNGTVELSGASANMYGMDIVSGKRDLSHSKIIELLRKAREVQCIKKVLIKSGVRFDIANEEYIREIIKYHIDGTLMIAPEHVDEEVVALMGKGKGADEFAEMFERICKEENSICELSYYFIVGHPGCNIENTTSLNRFISGKKHANFVQVFTPTPMTMSTCMYYTSIDPRTMKEIYVPYTYNEKKMQKNIALSVSGKEEMQKTRGFKHGKD
jgi:radical SAM superfamily enzyme YgiQ (UPF0313 family)